MTLRRYLTHRVPRRVNASLLGTLARNVLKVDSP